MTKHEETFTYKGVTFKKIKEGKNATMFEASADFLTSRCIEVWQNKIRKESSINGNVIKGGIKRPNNNDYPFSAHQFLASHFKSEQAMIKQAELRFQEYEQGLRPKKNEL
jgi:hypothetical protein